MQSFVPYSVMRMRGAGLIKGRWQHAGRDRDETRAGSTGSWKFLSPSTTMRAISSFHFSLPTRFKTPASSMTQSPIKASSALSVIVSLAITGSCFANGNRQARQVPDSMFPL
mmetsp:Transcript_4398/g.9750  ORF Transcript_4398/g.9750 Transcript_4398/m.9750 type:complete len:112 (+) Transcript_4398:454-789(+)